MNSSLCCDGGSRAGGEAGLAARWGMGTWAAGRREAMGVVRVRGLDWVDGLKRWRGEGPWSGLGWKA